MFRLRSVAWSQHTAPKLASTCHSVPLWVDDTCLEHVDSFIHPGLSPLRGTLKITYFYNYIVIWWRFFRFFSSRYSYWYASRNESELKILGHRLADLSIDTHVQIFHMKKTWHTKRNCESIMRKIKAELRKKQWLQAHKSHTPPDSIQYLIIYSVNTHWAPAFFSNSSRWPQQIRW